VVVEATDVIFAVDSIPAILAVTTDPFVVYTSNVFALLGMRALYSLLAGAAGRLRYLRPGLAVILAAVAVKLLLADVWEFPAAGDRPAPEALPADDQVGAEATRP
jgi:tellurite resistance protein TerC